MEALEITAELAGPIVVQEGIGIALDALLMAAVCRSTGIPPATTEAELVPIEIPVAREGGIYLASVSSFAVEARERTWVNRRFPVAEAQRMGDAKLKRIDIATGPCKSFRIPMELKHLEGDRVRWWCVGEAEPIRALLGWVGYLGKKRSVGRGQVRRWTVEPCARWPGFPVVRDGQPLRALPVDWPGLSPDVDRGYAVLNPPRWIRTREVECAVPR
jgi:CRISPR type IV-associated protein Csf3